MNDLTMLAPEDCLTSRVTWMAFGDPQTWWQYRCIPCLLTRDVDKAWTFTDFANVVGPRFQRIVAASDFYEHLKSEHGFDDYFAEKAARRLK